VPDDLDATGGGGAAVGIAVGCAGTAVGAAPPLVDGAFVGGTAVGEVLAGAEVGEAGTGVAVAEEPQANMATNRRAKGPRIIILGFFNQRFKTD